MGHIIGKLDLDTFELVGCTGCFICKLCLLVHLLWKYHDSFWQALEKSTQL